ncbi:SNF2 family N-terminal domain-containing protein [Amylocarpus encephaloides]|uniref:SNF2 family N-terminal domain-containing protein n=1 Tax=Amylocarpus encephaloides TaxID=45428 RepID=A0A9P7YLD0_9HELO|nr:SNF2 family N-terminal domain-containing protein [Amylocarpus encephaloides]
MAPSARPRGRPKKIASLNSSATTSRPNSTSTRRSLRNAVDELAISSSASAVKNAVSPIADYDASSDFPEVSMLGEHLSAKTAAAQGKGCTSTSSISTSNDYNESSGYSTPATSAVATPMPQTKTTVTSTRRGRSSTNVPNASTGGMSLVAKAAALRNSKWSLSSKRKHVPDSDEEEDMREDADALLARTLQAEEDAAAASNAMDTDTFVSTSSISVRRTPRNLQKIKPKAGFVADLSDDDLEMMTHPSRPSKRARIVLSAGGSNGVHFKSTKETSRFFAKVNDSLDEDDNSLDSDDVPDDPEDAEGFVVTESEDSDAPLATSASRRRGQAVSGGGQIKSPPTRKQNYMASRALQRKPLPSMTTSSRSKSRPTLGRQDTTASSALSSLGAEVLTESEAESFSDFLSDTEELSDADGAAAAVAAPRGSAHSRVPVRHRRRSPSIDLHITRRSRLERIRLETHHPELHTMWKDLEDLPKIGDVKIDQPANINRELKPFQLQGVAWMKAMEKTDWGGGLLGDEMGMGKTIQAVSLIMSDFPAKQPSLVLIPPVALMQWQQEIADYTDGTLKTFVYHGTNIKTKGISQKELMKYNVILMSYNSLESMYRKQEKGFKRKHGVHKEKSIIHQIKFHRVILDEAHNIKQRTTGSAKACFALKADHKWCLSGTPLQNRIGEFFSLVRFLDIRPFASYFCKQCPCSHLNWEMNADNRCTGCNHSGMQHVSVFNQELLNPIQKFGNNGPGKEAFRKLRILTDRFMLRRVKRDHSSAMELPVKEIYVDRHFFGEEENDFAGSIMNSGTRKFETYVAQGVLLNNYANIFGLIMQMRQVADHPDLILKKGVEGGQNVLVCCICDETAEEAIRSTCRHDFCRECVKNYLRSSDSPDCPHCHIPLSIDLEQPDIEQDEQQVKKSSIINRIKMENWTSSSKIEALVHNIWQLRSKHRTTKSIIFSQFTTMLQLVEWRLRRAGITTVMLDGSMTPAQRQASINHFMTNVNVECFLVSLKAGGVALNLTQASHVFIVDPWWNPAAEWQSADRCHRIGQARPCSITRLCIEDSVESRMVLLQEKKANMINSTINSDQSAMESLTPEDMQFLFRGT